MWKHCAEVPPPPTLPAKSSTDGHHAPLVYLLIKWQLWSSIFWFLFSTSPISISNRIVLFLWTITIFRCFISVGAPGAIACNIRVSRTWVFFAISCSDKTSSGRFGIQAIWGFSWSWYVASGLGSAFWFKSGTFWWRLQGFFKDYGQPLKIAVLKTTSIKNSYPRESEEL